MNNDEIFKFINPNSNDTISNMKSKDLVKLISLLQEYYITYRDSLNLDKNITFGLELEYENCNRYIESKVLNKTKLYGKWNMASDGSLIQGEEIKSPILIDEKDSWYDLKEVCNMVKKYAKIGPHSGGHIHIGTNILEFSSENLFNFLKVWLTYENIIYRFSYGEYLSGRPSINEYAQKCRMSFDRILNSLNKDSSISFSDAILKVKNESRYYGVNFYNMKDKNNLEIFKNTIEFRCPNGTLEHIVWQNNVNLFTNLLIFSRNKNFNEDIINKREKKEIWNEMYNEIYIEKAVELADLIFNNNLDKLNFLRQYFKSFECSNNMIKAKTFVKN